MEDHWFGSKVRATFEPKRLDTLRECMKPLVGKSFIFEWAGTMDEGVYSGQSMWMMDRSHDPELPDECKGRWSPREDLNITEELDDGRLDC